MQICRGGAELTPAINEDWAWLHKSRPGVLTLKPALTGTCRVGQNSTEVILDIAQPTIEAEFYFKAEGHPDVFLVSSYDNGTATITLDAVYTGATNNSASYTVFQLGYNLASDVMRVTAPMRCYVSTTSGDWGRYKIYRAATDNMDTWEPLSVNSPGIPDLFAEIGPTATNTKRVRFNRYIDPTSTNYVRVEYDYLYRPTALTSPGTSEEPVLPREWRHVLSDYVLAYLFGQKNDDRVSGAVQAAQAGLVGMAHENRYRTVTATPNLFRIQPRATFWNTRGPLRTEQGHIIG